MYPKLSATAGDRFVRFADSRIRMSGARTLAAIGGMARRAAHSAHAHAYPRPTPPVGLQLPCRKPLTPTTTQTRAHVGIAERTRDRRQRRAVRETLAAH